jgi:hypothetical protein
VRGYEETGYSREGNTKKDIWPGGRATNMEIRTNLICGSYIKI